MRISTISFLIFVLLSSTSTANALNANSIIMPIERILKTIGISSLEKTILKNAKYVSHGGKLIAQRNSTFFSHAKDGLGRTNIERMEAGMAPIGKDGKAVELHHLKQKDKGIIIELTNKEHRENSKILHRYKQKSEIDRNAFNRFKNDYWKERARELR